MDVQQIKDLILLSAKLHEESYEEHGAMYCLDTKQAIKKVCKDAQVDPDIVRMIELLLQPSVWNNTLEWADNKS
jgi:hypothetical protein